MKRLTLALGLTILFLAVIYFSAPFLLTAAAEHLLVKDKLEKADIILVLGGDDNGERVHEAVKLFNQGYAKKILMSGGRLAWHLTYSDLMKKQAMSEGVPGAAILAQASSESTIEDAKFSLPIIERYSAKSVIVVTSPTHTRRAKAIFQKYYSKAGIKIMVEPVENSEFKVDHWWRRHRDTQLVAWEYASRLLQLLKHSE